MCIFAKNQQKLKKNQEYSQTCIQQSRKKNDQIEQMNAYLRFQFLSSVKIK